MLDKDVECARLFEKIIECAFCISRKGGERMNKIITISREFGSGGREVGKRLADELGFRYYDAEIITAIAKETGMSEQYIQNISEKGIYPYAFHFAKSFATYPGYQSNQTEVLVAEAKVLKQIATKGDCIIVGRGADATLRECEPMNLFVYANMQSKMERCRQKRQDEKDMPDKELEKKIKQIDKNRRNYHRVISNLEWGEKENYHLCINTSGIEIKEMISPLADYIEEWFRRKK